MRTALLIPLLFQFLLAEEPSALGAGNLDAPNPYGLTSAEKNILKNKEILSDLKKKSYANQTQVGSLLERIDGLQTVVEGLTKKAHENQFEIQRIQEQRKAENTPERLAKIDERLAALEAVAKANEENIIQLKKVMEEFSKMIDTINTNYVSKDEYNALVKDVNEFKTLVSKELKSIGKTASKTSASSTKMSNGELATAAAANYKKKYYTKAIEQYEE
jgi:methyl-accepting chemotaxis protein